MEKIKVVIHVHGGAIQSIYAPEGSNLDITLIDEDCDECGESEDDIDTTDKLNDATKGLVEFPF